MYNVCTLGDEGSGSYVQRECDVSRATDSSQMLQTHAMFSFAYTSAVREPALCTRPVGELGSGGCGASLCHLLIECT